MKTLLLISFLTISMQVMAQNQAETYIKEAQTYLAAKDYKQAQMSLQDAINDLNLVLGQQIAEALPNEINGLTAEPGDASNTGGMNIMGIGMVISKSYRNAGKKENEADVQILANSPMLAAINMYINNPAMAGQGYKSVRVGTRRAILKSEMNDFYMDNGSSKQIRSSEIQIPLSQTLITLNLKGFASEAEELAFAGKLDIEKLRVALGE
ncbi:MAG: hypothetical protein M3R25_00100 [Bacteroidota bacterium]|nr:hypothetical protein [Bacteroidota bacterium]